MRAPSPGTTRPARRARIAAALAAGFLVLAAAVSAGGLDRLDQAAVDHAMPLLSSVQGGEPTLAERALPTYDASAHRGEEAAALAVYVITLPASALPSALLAAAGLALLWRRGARKAALRVGIAFVAAVAVELVCKAALERPALELSVHGQRERLVGFDSSYPSGHALRTLLLCVIAARLWPRARPAAVAAACVVALLLDLGGVHPPSDIAGGLLLGGALALWALPPGASVDARGIRCNSRPRGDDPGGGREMRGAMMRALALGAALAAGGALSLPAGALAAGPHFSPFVLPRVIIGPCGSFCDIAEVAISNTGQVVGSTSANGGNDMVWTWRPGLGVQILGAGPFGLGAVPSAVADDGDIVGAMQTPDGQRAFLIHDGSFLNLGVLPGAQESGAAAINDRGQIAVNVVMSTGFAQAALWTPRSGLHGLGTHGGLASHATGINDAGEVVGFFSPAHGRDRAFLWRHGRMINLGALRGPASGHESRAFAINNAGVVVGGSLLAHEAHAVRWSPGRRISDLGLGVAVDVNEVGDVLFVDRLLTSGKIYDLSRRTIQFGGANGSSLNDRRQMVSGECFVARCRPRVLEPVSPFDDDRDSISYAGPWTRSPMPGAWRGRTTHATAAGATATFHFTGRRVWWVAPRSPEGGSARVVVDGVPAATVSLHAAETIPRQTAFQRGFASPGPHTLRIVVTGAGRVDVDAFTVSRF